MPTVRPDQNTSRHLLSDGSLSPGIRMGGLNAPHLPTCQGRIGRASMNVDLRHSEAVLRNMSVSFPGALRNR